MSTVATPPPAPVAPTPAGGPAAALPSVNLLPGSYASQARSRRTWRWVIVAAVAVVALLGVVWLVQQARISKANDDLARANQALATAQAELRPLIPYQTFARQLAAQAQTISTAMAHQYSLSTAMVAVASAAPPNTTLASLSFDTTKTCAGPDPFVSDPAMMGCATIGATVSDQTAAETLMRQLAATKGLTAPFLSSMVVGTSGTQVSATANLTTELLTHRYDDLAKKATQ